MFAHDCRAIFRRRLAITPCTPSSRRRSAKAKCKQRVNWILNSYNLCYIHKYFLKCIRRRVIAYRQCYNLGKYGNVDNAFCRRNGVGCRVAQPGWFVMDFHARPRFRNDYLFSEAIITNGILFFWSRNIYKTFYANGFRRSLS